MANGRKEPWEQLGYIAGTGSRVVTQDPLSAITEAGADNFWKWLNNQTAYAKAAEQTEQAQKHQLERDKTQSKDAFKLQKSEGLQRLSEIEEKHRNDTSLEQSKIFRSEIATMREQAELDPHAAVNRAESMLLDKKHLTPEMVSLLESNVSLFQRKADQKDARVALSDELLKYTSPERVLEHSSKEFNSRLIEKFPDGTSKLTIPQQQFYQGKRDQALKEARAREPFKQQLISDLRRDWQNAINTLGNIQLSPETYSKADKDLAEENKEHLARQLSQAMAGSYADIDSKYASTAKFYEALVLAEGYKLTDKLSPELNAKFLQQATDAYLESKGKKPKKIEVKPLRVKEVREKGISIKARDTVTLKSGVTGEEKTVQGIKANPMIASGAWDVVGIKSISLPKPKVRPRQTMGPLTAGITFEARADFPRSVKEGFELQDSKGSKYTIDRIFKEDGIQKALLRNIETGQLFGHPNPKKFTYADIFQEFTGGPPSIE